MAGSEINEIGEELNIEEHDANLVNNVILKPKEFGESSKRNTILWNLEMLQHYEKLTVPLGLS